MIVILAEKPSVARDISKVLGATNQHQGYLEGNGYAVTWAFGHLVGLANPDSYDPKYKTWNFQDLPIIPDKFKLSLNSDAGARKQFSIIKQLFNNSLEVVNACDSGREGSLIFRYILEKSNVHGKTLKRLWISSLTTDAIKKGFQNLEPLSNYDNLGLAARARSESDWLVGLNGTRAYTTTYSSGRNVLSIGRVQTPVLAMIVKRDREIKNFVSEQFWEIFTTYRDTIFKYDGDRFFKQTEANDILNELTEELEIIDIEKKDKSEAPPQLYDLTTLQRQLNQRFNYSAQKTLSLLQNLYEKKFVTYPRTDSRYLSEDIYPECSKILNKLQNQHPAIHGICINSLTKRKTVFNDKKVSDHHAIIPTGQLPSSLSSEEQNVFDAVLTRFIIQFVDDCKKAITKVKAKVKQHLFTANGSQLLVLGWREWEATPKKETVLPEFIIGEKGPHDPEIKDGWTKPPSFFNEASLLGAMETAGKEIDDKALREIMKGSGIGTPATRASIIETLLKRAYILRDKKNLKATEKGISLIDTIQIDTLKSPELTGEWEKKLSAIQEGTLSYDKFIDNVKKFTHELVNNVQENKSNSSLAEITEADYKIANCPNCNSIISENAKAYGCENRECDFVIWKSYFGKKISRNICVDLISKGKTKKLAGFKSQKSGNKFEASLKLSEGKVSLDFDQSNVQPNSGNSKELGKCPMCSGAVVDKGPKLWACSKQECKFVIWKVVSKKQLNEKNCKDLLETGRTEIIRGFKSKAGKTFSAPLVLNNDKVEFVFN